MGKAGEPKGAGSPRGRGGAEAHPHTPGGVAQGRAAPCRRAPLPALAPPRTSSCSSVSHLRHYLNFSSAMRSMQLT